MTNVKPSHKRHIASVCLIFVHNALMRLHAIGSQPVPGRWVPYARAWVILQTFELSPMASIRKVLL